jgi:lactate dehydrogenase-like 2-hydroxyacid dehydrogenase
MLCIARKLPLQIKNEYKESFTKSMLQTQVEGKKAGILGLGSIGTKIAELLKELGMEVSYWSRKSRNSKFKYEELEDIFATCDFIFPAYAVNGQTKLIITDELLDSMKKSASIISIVGTEVFNLNTLLNKVKNNEIYGVAFEKANDNIANFEGNVMVTSPYAWYTKESFKNLIEVWTTVMESFASKPINKV